MSGQSKRGGTSTVSSTSKKKRFDSGETKIDIAPRRRRIAAPADYIALIALTSRMASPIAMPVAFISAAVIPGSKSAVMRDATSLST